jgi:hypothetical protein
MTTLNVETKTYTYNYQEFNSFEIVRPYFDISQQVLYFTVNLIQVDKDNPRIYRKIVQSYDMYFEKENFTKIINLDVLYDKIITNLGVKVV